jgi:hypothetical protein
MTNSTLPKRRRIMFIHPGLQGGAALCFAVVVVAGAALFALFVYNGLKQALWDASYMGHFRFRTPYQVVDDILLTHLAGLFLGVLCVSFAVFFLLVHRIRAGIGRVTEVLAASGKGDLSTPTEAPGLKAIASFGKQVDAARSYTLSRIGEIRAELDILSSGPQAPEEFRKRWDSLKEKIGRLAP